MTGDPSHQETFAEFKDSFSDGSRTDLAFKFLKNLSPEDAATFFQELLEKLGETIDDGRADRLMQHASEWQVRGYAAAERRIDYDDRPYAPLRKPLDRSRVALFTSSGHFVAGDDPRPFGVADMTQEEAVARIDDFLRAAPQLSVIPTSTPASRLRVRHGAMIFGQPRRIPMWSSPWTAYVSWPQQGLLASWPHRPTPLSGQPPRRG
jgi:hypothetical protein